MTTINSIPLDHRRERRQGIIRRSSINSTMSAGAPFRHQPRGPGQCCKLARIRPGGAAKRSEVNSFLQKKENTFMVKVLRVGEPERPMRINTPQMALRYWNGVIRRKGWFDEAKEHLVALLLNTRLHIQGYSLVSIGSLNESIAHPREIFRAAVAAGAFGVIILHNHPSGDASPSNTDLAVFARIKGAGGILGVEVRDQIIVGAKRRYFSLHENEIAKEQERASRRKSPRRSTKRIG